MVDLKLPFRVDLDNHEAAIRQHFRIRGALENQPFFSP